MRRIHSATAYAATFLVGGGLLGAVAVLPPALGFLIAVCAAFGWSALLELAPRPWRSSRPGGTIRAVGALMPLLTSSRPLPYWSDRLGFPAAAIAVGAATALYVRVLRLTDPTIVALSFLLIVVVIAAVSSWRVAITTSMLAFVCFNFFFLPPVGTLVVADAQHWVALFTLLAVSLIASYLSSEVRQRAQAAVTAEVARASAELKSSLLASIGHDLKTPLTALTVAAGNLTAEWLTDEQRSEQTEIVRQELARLNRLFQNLIDLARIESQAIAAEPEWVPPADVIDAAVQQVAPALSGHRMDLDSGSDQRLVLLDPRLTSAALAHVLENAAQHSPPGAPISVAVVLREHEVQFVVRDRGSGVAATSDRNGRPTALQSRSSGVRAGTGMGLAISRGLLSAEGGRLWGENHPAGGAVFTLAIPGEHRFQSEFQADRS